MTFQTPPAPLAPGEIERVVRAALDEDAAGDDVTTRWTVPAEAVASAEILQCDSGHGANGGRDGVDLISIGRLTHSAPALNVSLLVGEVVSPAGRASPSEAVRAMQD